jgi:hypothetical protein
MYAFGRAALEVEIIANEMTTQRTIGPIPELMYAVMTLFFLLICGSLKFMWDIRHPSAE